MCCTGGTQRALAVVLAFVGVEQKVSSRLQAKAEEIHPAA